MTARFVPERSDEEIEALFRALHSEPDPDAAVDADPVRAYLAEAAAAFATVTPGARQTTPGETGVVATSTDVCKPDLSRSDGGRRRTARLSLLAAACVAVVAGLWVLGGFGRTSAPSQVATGPVAPAPASAGFSVGSTVVANTAPPERHLVFSEAHGLVAVGSEGDVAAGAAIIVAALGDGPDWTSKTVDFPPGAIVHALAAHRSFVVVTIEYTVDGHLSPTLGVAHTSDLDTWTISPAPLLPVPLSPTPIDVPHLVVNDLGVVFVAVDSSGVESVVAGPLAGPFTVTPSTTRTDGLAAADSWFAAASSHPATLATTAAIDQPFATATVNATTMVSPIVLATGDTVVALDRSSEAAVSSGDRGVTWEPARRPGGMVEAAGGGPAGVAFASTARPSRGAASMFFESAIASGALIAECLPGWDGPDAALSCRRTVLTARPNGSDPTVGVDMSPAEIPTTVMEWESNGYVLQLAVPAGEGGGIGIQEIGLMPHRLTDPSGHVIHERQNGGGLLAGVVALRLVDGDDLAFAFFEPGTSDVLVEFGMSEVEAAPQADGFARVTKSGFTFELTESDGFPDGVLLDADGVEVHRFDGQSLLFGANDIFRLVTGEAGETTLIVTDPDGADRVSFDLSEDPVTSSGRHPVGNVPSRELWFSVDGIDWTELDSSGIHSSAQIDSLVIGDGVVMVEMTLTDGKHHRITVTI